MIYFLRAIAFITILLIIWILYIKDNCEINKKRYGKKGEKIAKKMIKCALNKDDILLSNVIIDYKDKTCECDDIVINKNGVFIIEVKNYIGHLSGGVNDSKWKKTKISKSGVKYTSMVKNPFIQVSRNVNLLSNFLLMNELKSLVKGYIMVPNNNQILGKQVLRTSEDIDREIHNEDFINENDYLTKVKQKEIYKLIK